MPKALLSVLLFSVSVLCTHAFGALSARPLVERRRLSAGAGPWRGLASLAPAARPRTATLCVASSAAASPGSTAAEEATLASTKDEALAGLVVALASLPMSIAFANIAGVSPLVGIWSSVVLGLVSALVGGSPGLIAGAAGVVVVPLAPLLAVHGAAAVAPCVLLAAAVQLACSFGKVGQFMRLVDDNVMKGFLNGLGLLLAQSQVANFAALSGAPLAAALALAGATAATVAWLPRVTMAVPPALAGVALATAAAAALPYFAPALAATCHVATLAGAAGGAATFAGGWGVLPRFLDLSQLAHTPLSLWRACAPAAASVAAIAVLETLLAAKVAAQGKPPPPASSRAAGRANNAEDRVLLGLGLGNALSALVGGFGGCGLIPQTVLNAQAGGRTRASSGAYAAATALSVVFFAPLIGAIPVASLSGLMLTVAAATVQGPYSARVLRAAFRQQPVNASVRAWAQLAVLAATSATCFAVDMAAGIGAGVALTALLAKVLPKEEVELAPAL